MRPLTLQFTGLRSYDTCGPIEFTGKSLVGILGDTGAGKSTILEGLCVALYGKCSWSDRDVRDLIADGAQSMTVGLTFAHDGHTWRIRRVYYSNAMPSTHLLENVDTGWKIDNARPVEHAVERLLRMDFAAFRSAVLLPQGRFATLLHATGRDRAELLKGIFGTDTVDIVREIAIARRSSLSDLLGEAGAARAQMRPDPAAAAEEARADAEESEQGAEQLNSTLERMRRTQQGARNAQTITCCLTDTARALSTAAITLAADRVVAELAAIQAAEAAVENTRAQLDREERQAQTSQAAADKALAAAASAGETSDQLAAAASTLGALPCRLADISAERQRLGWESDRLATERQELDAAAAAEPALQFAAETARAAADSSGKRLDEAREATAALTDRIRAGLDAAVTVAAAQAAADELAKKIATGQASLPGLQQAEDAAEGTHRDAQQALFTAQRAEAAATAGAHLHAGDTCPVCASTLPDRYRAPQPADPVTLDMATELERASSRELTEARNARQHAERDLESLRTQHTDVGQNCDEVGTRLRSALGDVRIAATNAALTAPLSIQGLPSPTELVSLDSAALAASVEAAAAELATSGDPSRTRSGTLTRLVSEAERYCASLKQVASKADQAATASERDPAAAKARRAGKDEAFKRDMAAIGQAWRRLTTTQRQIAADLAELPTTCAAEFPAPPDSDEALASYIALLTEDRLNAATTAVTARRAQVEKHAADQSTAGGELTRIANAKLSLTERFENEVAKPLRILAGKIKDACATLIPARELLESDDVVTVLAAPPAQLELPQAPDDLTVEAIRRHARDAASAITHSRYAVMAAAEIAGQRAAALLDELATRLRAAYGETDGVITSRDMSADLLGPSALDGIAAMAALATPSRLRDPTLTYCCASLLIHIRFNVRTCRK